MVWMHRKSLNGRWMTGTGGTDRPEPEDLGTGGSGLRRDPVRRNLCEALEHHGFAVTRHLVNIPTAFKGVWGKGRPVVGILGEYDALPGLSQEAGCPVKKPEHEAAPAMAAATTCWEPERRPRPAP